MKIKVLNYAGDKTEYEIPDTFSHIEVRVLSGDEVVTVFNGDGNIIAGPFDPERGNRRVDYHDGVYTVTLEGIEEWSNREQSYDMKLGPDYEMMNEVDALWYDLTSFLEEL